jgi:hypothetical protein
VDTTFEVAKQNTDRAEKDYKNLENDPSSSAWQELAAQRALLENEEQQAQSSLNILENPSEDDYCPTCKQRLIEHARGERIDHLTKWLTITYPTKQTSLDKLEVNIRAQQASLQTARATAYKAWQAAYQIYQVAVGAVQSRDSLAKQLETAASDLGKAVKAWNDLAEKSRFDPNEEGRLQTRRQELQDTANSLEQKRLWYESIDTWKTQIEELKGRIEPLQVQRQEVVTQLAQLGYDGVAHQACQDAADSKETTYNGLRNKHSQACYEIAQSEASLESAIEAVNQAESCYAQFTHSLDSFIIQDQLFTLLKNLQDHFFNANTRKVALRARELVAHAVKDGSIVGLLFDGNDL